MNDASVFDSLWVCQNSWLLGLETYCVLLRFRFATQSRCNGLRELLLALFFGQHEIRNPHPKCKERDKHCTNNHLVKQCFFYHGASSWFCGLNGIGLLGNAGGSLVGKGQSVMCFLLEFGFNGFCKL